MFRLFFLKIFNLPENSSIIIFQGGLGNQLFQYYLGEELRNSYNKNVTYFDLGKSYKSRHNSKVQNIFNLKINKYILNKNNFIIKNLFLSPIILKICKFIYQKTHIQIFSNLYIDFDNKPINLNTILSKRGITIFFGTWHNLINKYKLNFDQLNIKFLTQEINFPKLNLNKDFISLHVRRGDYVNNKKTSIFHGNLKISYYLKAVNILRQKFGNLPVYLFSDDHQWLKENLCILISNSVVISSDNIPAEIDFCIMSKGRHFIISNSTFAWWSAFFSPNKNKYIILPKFWFSKFSINSNYIFKDWNYEIIE